MLSAIHCHTVISNAMGSFMGIVNLVGGRYGKLMVLRFSHIHLRKAYWVCLCDCGEEKILRGNSLRSGNTTSCGCFHKEQHIERLRSHGLSKERVYRIWAGIKTRCFTNNHHSYLHYGARGITICKEWEDDFLAFYNWAMANGYDDDLTIERREVNGNYEPNNCTWIPARDQPKNRRTSLFIDFQDLTMTPTEFSNAFDIPYTTVIKRLSDGWSANRILARRW